MFQGLLNLAKSENVELAIVGPEVPLVAGLADVFKKAGILCFGPSARAAQLEGSKAFAKQFMVRHQIPTAKFRIFTQYLLSLSFFKLKLNSDNVRYEEAAEYLASVQHDVVIKVWVIMQVLVSNFNMKICRLQD